MKISISNIKEIEKACGSFKIYETIGNNPKTYLRFGYWQKINLNKLSALLGPNIEVYEDSIYDEDCGWKYSYKVKQK